MCFITAMIVCTLVTLLQNTEARADDPPLKNTVLDCIAEVNLNLTDLGITSIDEIQTFNLVMIHQWPRNKIECFMACWFKHYHIINQDGTINTNELPEPLPNVGSPEDFTKAITACKALTDYCQVGGCLYDLYYT
ncbi:uncharacterized protein LOC106637840 [Copidosoma floridanum]|uniref:uncharacterized protein LOC106637840 n=1 Tax=Copidosoma floridanum TaxID=29053 RepID=UPI0006C969A7|nr:uncharacterized protein LOC106637840 [Copidosoma floridanum]